VALKAWISERGLRGVTLAGNTDATTVYVEFWNVREGAFRMGNVEQHEFWQRLGALSGATLGAWASALTGGRGASLSEGWAIGSRKSREVARVVSHAMTDTFGTYRETMTWLPDVVCSGSNQRHSLVLGMLTDSSLARFADRALGYGFDKQRGQFEVSPAGWAVSDASGRRAITFRAAPECANGLPVDLRELEAAARLPLLGITRRGELVRSWLGRSFASVAEIRPIAGTLDVSENVVPGFRGTYEIPEPVRTDDWRAVRFSELPVTVSQPIPAS
jgi:hypothetical protein